MGIRVRVKWPGGYVDVADSDPPPTRMIPVDAGNVRNVGAAVQVGATVLATYATRPLRSYSVSVGDTPSWPSLGDAIETVGIDGSTLVENRLVARKVSITNTGHAQFEPTLATVQDQFALMTALKLKQLTTSASGQTTAGKPLVQPEQNVLSSQLSEQGTITWSQSPIRVRMSPIQKLSEPTTFTRMQILMTKNTDDGAVPETLPYALTLTVKINGTSVGPITYPANTFEWNILGGGYWPSSTTIQVGIASLGSNTYGNTAKRALTINFMGVTGSFVKDINMMPEVR